jgi:hypothetical protein
MLAAERGHAPVVRALLTELAVVIEQNAQDKVWGQ